MNLKYNSEEFLKVLATSKMLKSLTNEELQEFINDTEKRLANEDYKNLSVIDAELYNAKVILNKRLEQRM